MPDNSRIRNAIQAYENVFIAKAQTEAEKIHMQWLTAKYERIATLDILAVIDRANTAKQVYAEAYNDLAALHGIGINNGEIEPVESPVIRLARILDGKLLTLSGREHPTAEGIAPLQAKISMTEPISGYTEQAYGHIHVELIDPNTREVINVFSFIDKSILNPGEHSAELEPYIVRDAENLRARAVEESPQSEFYNGHSKSNDDTDIYTTTCDSYKITMSPENSRSEYGGASCAVLLHNVTNNYVMYLKERSDQVLERIGLLEWIMSSAKDGDLNPYVVERMEDVDMPPVSTLPDEYTIVFKDGQPIVIPIEHIDPFKDEQPNSDLTPLPTEKSIPKIRRGGLFGKY